MPDAGARPGRYLQLSAHGRGLPASPGAGTARWHAQPPCVRARCCMPPCADCRRRPRSFVRRSFLPSLPVVRDFRFPVTGTAGWEHAQVTAGGIPLSEVDVSTMESPPVPRRLSHRRTAQRGRRLRRLQPATGHGRPVCWPAAARARRPIRPFAGMCASETALSRFTNQEEPQKQ